MRSLTLFSMATSLLLATGCGDKDEDDGPADTGAVDADGDGFSTDEDCDDADPDVNPDATEICDGIDNDCDTLVDDADDSLDGSTGLTLYSDADGDGFGDAGSPTIEACEATAGQVEDATDCDDSDPAVNPGATEVCNDGVDDDCDGSADDDDDVIDTSTFSEWYADADGDGFGNAIASSASCEPAEGEVADDTDCDDTDPAVNPDAIEVCNDGVDDDCDGAADDADASVDTSTFTDWYADVDGDGFGDAATSSASCDAPTATVADDTDCDDTDVDINPGATEVCNDGVDDDCDGTADDADASVDSGSFSDWYADDDGDGYGDAAASTAACLAPAGSLADDTDCDDTDATINPAATEVCNGGVDDDCDGSADDADASVDTSTFSDWYADDDGDGYGDATASSASCVAAAGSIADDSDCDDTDATVNPGATEVCNGGVDDDCDGSADDADTSVDTSTFTDWYEDADADGYGDAAATSAACLAPAGSIADDSDCDDTDATINPAATEACDGVDHNCDGAIDNDADGDGYSDQACGGTDCDDTSSSVVPEADGTCAEGDDCQDLYDSGHTTDGAYTIDPDGYGTGEGPIEVYCDMTTDGGGWTLCASLTKGYVPGDMLYNADLYAFQARLNGDNDYVFETDAPARTDATWLTSEELNYGQFCQHMGTGVTETMLQAKSWNATNNYMASARNSAYDVTKEGVFSGNLFIQWFTNSSATRTFTHVSGDNLVVDSNDNGYGGPYTTPSVSWSGGAVRTQSSNPWAGVDSSASCVGCTNHGSGYNAVPYTQDTILNDMSHSFWSGISDVRWGWSDCTAYGNCTYHESGAGVWLFWVR